MSGQETASPEKQAAVKKLETFDLFPHVNDALVLAGMIGLSYIGVAITSFAPEKSHWYWLMLVFVFAGVCIFAQWARGRGTEVKLSTLLRMQIFHWAALLVAIQVVYMLLRTGRIDFEATGFLLFLLLSFTTFLQGAHLDWRFYLVGLFLALSLILAIYVAAFLWVTLLIAILFVAAGFLLMRRGQAKT